MEFSSIEREIHIEATPDVVYEVISKPEHVQEWWPDEANYEPVPGSTGSLTFGEKGCGAVQGFTVMETDPPKRFSFRWTHAEGAPAAADNSLLVAFDLEPADGGTLVRMVETGFREQGWDEAKIEAEYRDHISGWDHFLPRLVAYAGSLVSTS